MAVLVEAISVIIQADRLLTAFGQNWEAFKDIVPNQTLCADSELVSVGFLSPLEVQEFCRLLEACGLQYQLNGQAQDLTVCDQQKGFMTPTDWAEFGRISMNNDESQQVAACRLKGSAVSQLMTPDGWEWENSLSREFLFLPLRSS